MRDVFIKNEKKIMIKIIVEIDYQGSELVVTKKDNQMYDITIGGEVVQPNHDAEGVMRALANYLNSSEYRFSKLVNSF